MLRLELDFTIMNREALDPLNVQNDLYEVLRLFEALMLGHEHDDAKTRFTLFFMNEKKQKKNMPCSGGFLK